MWVFGKPNRILFYKQHIRNLIKSLKFFKFNVSGLEKNIHKLIELNLNKNQKYNHLLRIAVNRKLISISIRKKLKLKKNFNLNLIKYKRTKPQFKNLMYKEILKLLLKEDVKSSDIGICYNNCILETATANILFVKKNKIYSPAKSFYKGITLKFFEKKIKKIIKKNVLLKSLSIYDEIILIGSGKGVVSIKSIKKLNWNRKSSKTYRYLLKIYQEAVTNCPRYYG